MIFNLIREYLDIIDEELYIKKRSIGATYNRLMVYPNNERIKRNYYKELKDFKDTLDMEKKVVLFLIKYNNKLIYDDIINTLDYLDDNSINNLLYIDDLIDRLNTACYINSESKFYVPRNKPVYIKDINEYLNKAKGFNIDSIKEYLLDEEVYDENNFNKVLDTVKYLSVVGEDRNIYSGVFNKGIVIPPVNDSKSTLIAIHEFVHKSLLINKNIIKDPDIVNSEIIPIFYEMLYKENNYFINDEIHDNTYARHLLYYYDDEPFLDQIEKLKLIKRGRF